MATSGRGLGMRNAGFGTRARAWWLRTFKGRRADEAAWTETEPAMSPSGSPAGSFALGELRIEAVPRGVKAAGVNSASAVWEVTVGLEGDPRKWSSRYGLSPRDSSAAGAVEVALDELALVWRDPDAWRAIAFEGMSEEEREAMEDSPTFRLDVKAAQWIGPHLDRVRERRETMGSWLPPG